MNSKQFTALAQVAGISNKSKRYAALEDVLVGGVTAAHAARKHGISEQLVRTTRMIVNTVHASIPDRIELLNAALGDGPPPRGVGGRPTHVQGELL